MDEATRRKEESRNPHGGRHTIGRHLRRQLGCNDSLNLLGTGPCHLQIIVLLLCLASNNYVSSQKDYL